jgi:hypothetical protein
MSVLELSLSLSLSFSLIQMCSNYTKKIIYNAAILIWNNLCRITKIEQVVLFCFLYLHHEFGKISSLPQKNSSSMEVL